MNSKIFEFFNSLYKYIQVSFYFWLFLLKGGVIYSLIPAFAALLPTVKEMSIMEEDEKHVKEVFAHHFKVFNRYKFASFIYSIIIITSFSSLYLLNRYDSYYTLILTIVVIYILSMTVILFTYSIFYLGNHVRQIKRITIISFVIMIKKIGKSVMMLIFIVFLFILAYINFFLFVIVAPFLYAISVNGTLRDLLREK